MYIVDGIAYASQKTDDLSVIEVKVLDGYQMIITFSTGEKRLLDVTELFEMPAFAPLRNEELLHTAKVAFGTVTWDGGNVDIGVDSLYDRSYPYESFLEESHKKHTGRL